MNFSSLGCKFKLKFELTQKLELQSFESARFYCTKHMIFLISCGLHFFQFTQFFCDFPAQCKYLVVLYL
jgi:hypothetical protein